MNSVQKQLLEEEERYIAESLDGGDIVVSEVQQSQLGKWDGDQISDDGRNLLFIYVDQGNYISSIPQLPIKIALKGNEKGPYLLSLPCDRN